MRTAEQRAIDADYERVRQFLEAKSVLVKQTPKYVIDSLRRLHRLSYSLSLWRHYLTNLADHSRVFLDELASDAVQVLPQVLSGYQKTTCLLMRGTVENALRHVYFADHRIEFIRMNQEGKWYMRMDELYEYVRVHPEIETYQNRFDCVNRLQTIYDELSSSIHARRVDNMEGRFGLEMVLLEKETLEAQTDRFARITEAVNFLLAAYHNVQFISWDLGRKRIVLRTCTKEARGAIRRLV